MLPKRRKTPLPTADACQRSNPVSTKKAAKKARKETRIESVPKKNSTALKSTLNFFFESSNIQSNGSTSHQQASKSY